MEGLLEAEVVDIRLHLGDRREVVGIDGIVHIIVVVEAEEDAVLRPGRLVLGDLESADGRVERRACAAAGGCGWPRRTGLKRADIADHEEWGAAGLEPAAESRPDPGPYLAELVERRRDGCARGRGP